MKNHFNRLLFALNKEIELLSSDRPQPIDRYKKAVLLCKKAMAKLKAQIADYRFARLKEEIEFFKTVKPGFKANISSTSPSKATTPNTPT